MNALWLWAVAFTMWIGPAGGRQVELRLVVPQEAIGIRVELDCEHQSLSSGRQLDPPAPPQAFRFTSLHADTYHILVQVRLRSGRIQALERDVFVRD